MLVEFEVRNVMCKVFIVHELVVVLVFELDWMSCVIVKCRWFAGVTD